MLQITGMTITVERLLLHARHGVMEQERRVGNDYEVSVSLNCDDARATETDDVADTVNYARVIEIIKQEMRIPSRLLEHVAGRIARALVAEFPSVSGGSVTVTKLHPPVQAPGLAGASVTLTFSR